MPGIGRSKATLDGAVGGGDGAGVLEGLEAVGLAEGVPLGVVGPGLVAVTQRRPGAGDVGVVGVP
jgi:hypothetical protein